jgi:hypothetical protein
MTNMHDHSVEFNRLDQLIKAHPPAAGSADLAERVMQQLTTSSPQTPIWQHQLMPWLAAAIGLFFTLGRLLGFIFSAWLSTQLAG